MCSFGIILSLTYLIEHYRSIHPFEGLIAKFALKGEELATLEETMDQWISNAVFFRKTYRDRPFSKLVVTFLAFNWNVANAWMMSVGKSHVPSNDFLCRLKEANPSFTSQVDDSVPWDPKDKWNWTEQVESAFQEVLRVPGTKQDEAFLNHYISVDYKRELLCLRVMGDDVLIDKLMNHSESLSQEETDRALEAVKQREDLPGPDGHVLCIALDCEAHFRTGHNMRYVFILHEKHSLQPFAILMTVTKLFSFDPKL